MVNIYWELWCQKQVYQAGKSNSTPQCPVVSNYVSVPDIPASGTKIFMFHTNIIVNSNTNLVN